MQKGFSLIELVIVIAIIGVIAAIAIPAYNGYVTRTNRTAVQAEMLRLSQEAQRFQVANRNFEGVTSKIPQLNSTFPAGKGHYTIETEVTPDNKGYTMTAKPESAQQQGDGEVVLNHRGEKCWTKGSTCTPSASSDWK